MRALVTGVAGFVGSHLADRLLEQRVEVVGLDSFTDHYPRELKDANVASLRSNRSFRLLEAAIQDVDWPPILSDLTHVFHLAAQPGVRLSWGKKFGVYTRANVKATQVLLEACVSARVERFVYASSSSVYGDAAEIPMREDARPQPLSPYGVTKLAAEHLCHLYWVNHGVPTVSLRYFTVYGPRQRPDMAFHRFLRALLTKNPICVFGDGKQTRDFTFIEDAVTATVAAADAGVPGSVYNIGGGSRVSVNRVLEVMARCTGLQPEIHHVENQKGDMRDTYADITRAKADLGFAPTVTLEDGVQAEFQWLSTAIVV